MQRVDDVIMYEPDDKWGSLNGTEWFVDSTSAVILVILTNRADLTNSRRPSGGCMRYDCHLIPCKRINMSTRFRAGKYKNNVPRV